MKTTLYKVYKKKLNIGCGKKLIEDAINLDFVKLDGVDIVHDLNMFPYPFKDNTFDEIHAFAILEHLDDLTKVFKEIHRILKPGGLLIGSVPYYNSEWANRDYTHKHFFTKSSFDVFRKDSYSHHYHNIDFELVEMQLIPTQLGMLVPFKKKLLNFVAMTFGNVVRTIDFKLKANK